MWAKYTKGPRKGKMVWHVEAWQQYLSSKDGDDNDEPSIEQSLPSSSGTSAPTGPPVPARLVPRERHVDVHRGEGWLVADLADCWLAKY